jgi:hypothetical protein
VSVSKKEFRVDNQIHKSGERVEKFCEVCGEERGHVVRELPEVRHAQPV